MRKRFAHKSLWVLLSLSVGGCGGTDVPETAGPTRIAFTHKTFGPSSLLAFPGEVQVWPTKETTPSDATAIIAGNGGTVVVQIPEMGYYIAGVTPGTEAAFIDVLNAHPSVVGAAPHGVVSPCSTKVYMLDHRCPPDWHANMVWTTITGNGGKVEKCFSPDIPSVPYWDGTYAPSWNYRKTSAMVKKIQEVDGESDEASFINLGFAGGDGRTDDPEAEWDQRLHLESLALAASRLQKDHVLIVPLGNNQKSMDKVFFDLRDNSIHEIDEALMNNILVVTTDKNQWANTVDTKSGKSYADRDVVVMRNPEAEKYGTSAAAAAATAILQQAAEKTGANPHTVLMAAKQAANKNKEHLLVLDEVIAQVNNMIGDSTRRVSLLQKGQTLTAEVTPVDEGVVLYYEITGTDGYAASGALYTDAQGKATVPLHPLTGNGIWYSYVAPVGTFNPYELSQCTDTVTVKLGNGWSAAYVLTRYSSIVSGVLDGLIQGATAGISAD